MADASREQVESAIKGFIDPHLETDLIVAKSVKDITVEGDKAKVKIILDGAGHLAGIGGE